MKLIELWRRENAHGLMLAGAVGLAALELQQVGSALWGREPIEDLVLAILPGSPIFASCKPLAAPCFSPRCCR